MRQQARSVRARLKLYTEMKTNSPIKTDNVHHIETKFRTKTGSGRRGDANLHSEQIVRPERLRRPIMITDISRFRYGFESARTYLVYPRTHYGGNYSHLTASG